MNDTTIPLLTVFFDGSCALCRAEMAEIAALDAGSEIRFVDCSPADFDDSPWRAEGRTRHAMMNALHVQDVLGDWHLGVDAFGVLYASVGAPVLARLWAHPLTRPFTRRLYPWVVRHRHVLSGLGLHLVAPKVLWLLSWRSARRARCVHGACKMPPGAQALPTSSK
jgi:predicted DCC family thiol-disulfide oxidoreductase YuxK